MSIYMSPVQYTLEDDSSYDTFANMQVGSNGDPYGDPTTSIGDIYGMENWDFNTWDSDVTSGFDTGNVPIQFDVKSDGTETLNAGANEPLTYQTGSIGSIGSVVIEAATQVNAEVKWSNVSVEFLNSGSVVETDSVGAGPDVNTIDSGSSTTEDQILTVTPSNTDCDEAIVFGVLRMHSPGISYPSSTAMFANVFVNGS